MKQYCDEFPHFSNFRQKFRPGDKVKICESSYLTINIFNLNVKKDEVGEVEDIIIGPWPSVCYLKVKFKNITYDGMYPYHYEKVWQKIKFKYNYKKLTPIERKNMINPEDEDEVELSDDDEIESDGTEFDDLSESEIYGDSEDLDDDEDYGEFADDEDE